MDYVWDRSCPSRKERGKVITAKERPGSRWSRPKVILARNGSNGEGPIYEMVCSTDGPGYSMARLERLRPNKTLHRAFRGQCGLMM